MSNYKIIDETIQKPIVSIAMLAYNHGKFISEAIESVLIQKVDFPIQLVIAEDCSPDNTREIILEYQKKYPKIIKLLLQNENVGAWQNNINLFEHVDGKYIAALEGDDYWIDASKLIMQVSFLEEHKDYSMCFHNAYEQFEGETTLEECFSNVEDRDYLGPEIYKNWIIPTASVLFRKEVIDNEVFRLRLKNKKFLFGDIILFISCGEFGKLRGFSKVMSVYRRHGGGAVFSRSLIRDLKQSYHDVEISNVFKGEYSFLAEEMYKKRIINGFCSSIFLGKFDIAKTYFEFIKEKLVLWDFIKNYIVVLKALKNFKKYS